MRKYIFVTIPLVLIALLISGCAKKEPAPKPKTAPSKAHEKLRAIAKDEYGLNLITHQEGLTFWVYLPVEKSLLEIKANDQGVSKSKEAKESVSIKYLDSQYLKGDFHIEYEISPSRNYASGYGYGSSYSEDYQKTQRNIFTAISRSFINIDSLDTDRAPVFFIIIISDVVSGLETETVFALSDLIRASSDQFFQEEYRRRILSGYPTGNQQAIDDRDGRHLKYVDLTWPEFIARQITHRIKFKYEQSTKKPDDNIRQVIIDSIAETIKSYEFKDYQAITLTNLLTQTTEMLDANVIENMNVDVEESKGRLIEIKFR